MSLRTYQRQAVDSVLEAWQESQSALIVMPTGTGKTRTFSEVVNRRCKDTKGRAMILAHRKEIVEQNAKAVSQWSPFRCDIEMGDMRALEIPGMAAHAISSSVQTQITGRMRLFDPNDFTLLVIDEAHHAVSPSWKEVIEYYRQNPKLKVLGVTATPDRTDEEALGKVFESVAFEYEILTAINDGWLVPVEQQVIQINSLDFSQIGTVAGDFNQGQLAKILEEEETTHGMAHATLENIGNRSTVVYTASVKQAELFSDILNRHRSGIAEFITGKTPREVREEILERFSSGKLQVVVNCAVLTEGWDAPRAEVIVLARPTKSRALYAQMVGRGLRPLPGLFGSDSSKHERQIAISASAKPKATILDFEGNAGRHKLMTTADILGGKYSEEVIEKAKENASKKGRVNMEAELEEAHKEIERNRRALKDDSRSKIILTADFQKYNIDPFNIFQIDVKPLKGWDRTKNLSEKQKDILLKNGFNADGMSKAESKAVLDKIFERRAEGLATMKQVGLLQKNIGKLPAGTIAEALSFEQARDFIDRLAKNRWQHV